MSSGGKAAVALIIIALVAGVVVAGFFYKKNGHLFGYTLSGKKETSHSYQQHVLEEITHNMLIRHNVLRNFTSCIRNIYLFVCEIPIFVQLYKNHTKESSKLSKCLFTSSY